MNQRHSPAAISFLVVVASLLFPTSGVLGEDLREYPNCTLVETDWADGDSFHVLFPDGSKKVIRLYFVDCIEKSASNTSDKRRLREQSRYFGVSDLRKTVEYGNIASEFTHRILSEPFTVFTALAKAPGRTASQRYYGFVHTSDGKDLGGLLIEKGLGRCKGIGRTTPAGTPRDENEERLHDLELRAALQKKGIWNYSNPDDLVHMREEEREELKALEAIDDALAVSPPKSPVDVNTASLDELTRTGLRESLADQVIQMRPFSSVDDLINVRGIGPVTLAKVRPYLRVAE